MKKNLVLFSLATILVSTSCSNHSETTESAVVNQETTMSYFGDSINPEAAVPASEIVSLISGKDSVQVKITGTIEEVCQKKGCWMKMNIGQEKDMMVRFKDYGFFVPKDAAGKSVIMEGFAFNDTIQVADLKHYAEDAGKTKEEIEKITEPEMRISFEANGLIIKN